MFNNIPPVVKNLIIINILILIAMSINEVFMRENFALFYPASPFFKPYQYITHMFMHGGIPHLLFNMYALFLFGSVLERVWGGKKFFIYYMITGLGAAALYTLVNYFIFSNIDATISAFVNTPSAELFKQFADAYPNYFNQNVHNFIHEWSITPNDPGYAATALENMVRVYQSNINIPVLGASGAVFGLLLGYGMLFPNSVLQLIFPPIAIKAKWLVIIYGGLELVLGLSFPGSKIAHFAHLGGMLFGFILIKYWNKKGRMYF